MSDHRDSVVARSKWELLCLTENLAGAGKLFSDAPRAEPPL